MDMQMPVMDGLEATRLIRAWRRPPAARRTPILMLSANALAEHASRRPGRRRRRPRRQAGHRRRLMGALAA